MRNITAGWETDLAILHLSGSSIDEFDDHLVVKSPNNPDFHWGNFVLVTDPSQVDNSVRWLTRFDEVFPDANWVSIGLPTYPKLIDDWTSAGIELERLDVLAAKELPTRPDLTPSYDSRLFRDDDWETLLKREISVNYESGEHEPVSFESFIRNSIENYRRLADQGLVAWVGAFSDDELVADLGIVVCGTIGRYQSVQTVEKHRKRGLASHLLGKAAEWSSNQGCDSWVIVTETTNDAGRVYRRAGFSPDRETVTASRRTR
jgi:GNAT superfamily N-acetyltransferase